MPPLRVMLIEDDRTYAWLVEEMLVEAFAGDPVEVESFDSLASATAEDGSVDCALVDLSLPDANGLGVIDSVIDAMPEVPVVVLSGAEDEALALRAVEHGAQDYLVKRRVNPHVLGRSVRYAVERKRSELQRAELLRARCCASDRSAPAGGSDPAPRRDRCSLPAGLRGAGGGRRLV
jgi:DNA-binding NtrC family response regulator